MFDTLVLSLPAHPTGASADRPWWAVADDVVVAQGNDGRWQEFLRDADVARRLRIVALAPAAATRIGFAAYPDATPKQAATIARLDALKASLGDEATLHAAASVPAEQGGRVTTAVVANGDMLDWIEWLTRHDAETAAILPVALVLPRNEDWAIGTIGDDAIAGRGDTLFAYEPDLARVLMGDGPVNDLSDDVMEAALLAFVSAPPLNLRNGRFARRRNWVFDKGRLRTLAILIGVAALLVLAVTVAQIWRLNASSDRLDAEAAQMASDALGRPVAIETALGELDTAAAQSGAAAGGLSGPVAALYRQMQAAPGVSATVLGWRGDGTLSATLAAARVEDINLVLVALQREGFTVTAVPRQGSDGRAMADLTIRTLP